MKKLPSLPGTSVQILQIQTRKTKITKKIPALYFTGCSPFQSGPHPGAIRAPIPLSGTE